MFKIDPSQFHYASGGDDVGDLDQATVIAQAQANEQGVHETVRQANEQLPRVSAQMEAAAVDCIRQLMIFLEGANGRAFVANTLGNAVEHAWDALVDFGFTVVTGDIHDRKYAAGQQGKEHLRVFLGFNGTFLESLQGM